MPRAVQACLWRAAGETPAYAILDGAQDPALLPALHADDAPPWRCLLPEALAPDMAAVAPYLVELRPDSPFTRRLLAAGWARNRGVFLASRLALAPLWRHVRAQLQVDGPALEPLLLRFYDPRVLRSYLPTCTPAQLAGFFGPVDVYLAESERADRAQAWSVRDGVLMAQDVG